MYKSQRGCLPYFTSLLGTILFVCVCTIFLIINVDSLFAVGSLSFTNETIKIVFSHLVISLIILILFLPWPLFFSEIFPAVRASKEGVKYRYLYFFGGLIRYQEIEEIADLKKPSNYKLIVISRKGFFIFNGLWMATFLGFLITGQMIPVLVLSPGIEDREKLLDEIQRNLS
jgi:hypothetical protein